MCRNQAAYYKRVLKRSMVDGVNSAPVPKIDNIKNPVDQAVSGKAGKGNGRSFSPREPVGRLLYMSMQCQPDIAFYVMVLRRSRERSVPAQWNAVKRVLSTWLKLEITEY